MNAQTREERIKEIELQTHMLHNLQKWMRNLIILSSVMLVLAYWAIQGMTGTAFTVLGIVCIIMMVLAALGCIVVGLGVKRGKANVDKISLTI
ncbi:MAG: hypothetical protein PHD70_04730 [Anaerostipes sp.]|jgi:ABC-type transport system involved in cytochrome bd biosynthesis fused ATPase/permease subunit|nr:hypothetical protein [Anaerostipes sp.]MDD4370040.1 hypothetical protein [Anaerostipes sp.]